MLGKLHEASQYMSKFKRKQKEKSCGRRRPDSVSFDHFRYDGYRVDSNSMDGSSKDCYEELREAIIEGLTKLNLLPRSCNEENAYFDRTTKLEFPSSTSCSQSSMFHSREFDTCDHSFQWSFEEKPKGTPFLDMDMDSSRRTLTSPVTDRFDHQRQVSKVSDTIKYNDSPPIVIIKPLKVSGSLEEDVYNQKQEFDIKEIIRNLNLKEVVPSRTDDGVIKLMEKIASTKMKEVVQIKEVIDEKADIVSTVLQDQISQMKAKPENLVSISPSRPLVETQLKIEDMQINPLYNHEDDLAVIKVTTSEEAPAGDDIDNTSTNSDYGRNKIESHLMDSSSLIKQKSTDKINDRKTNNNVTRNLLFDNPLFINKVEELFYTNNARQPLESRHENTFSTETTTPLLDCAKELLQNKSLIQSTKGVHQFTHVVTNKSKMFIFLDQIVGEVCKGFEDLKGYHKVNGETFAQNTLPKVLQMDLWCKGVVNGGWDLGWRSGFTSDEVEEIVVNIEQEILNEIIEDTVADMMMMS